MSIQIWVNANSDLEKKKRKGFSSGESSALSVKPMVLIFWHSLSERILCENKMEKKLKINKSNKYKRLKSH